jgi:hypothetical protein
MSYTKEHIMNCTDPDCEFCHPEKETTIMSKEDKKLSAEEIKQEAGFRYQFERLQAKERRAFQKGAEWAASQSESELIRLKEWKESAKKVLPDFQELGKLLNVPLGASVTEQIIPGIKALQSRIKELEQQSGLRWVNVEQKFLNSLDANVDVDNEFESGWGGGARWAFDWLKKHFEELEQQLHCKDDPIKKIINEH